MAGLVWDKVGDRVYESGVDRGVLYLPNGSAVPWNGLTSIIEKSDNEATSVYYDGAKRSDFITFGDYSATLKAITYPDEFSELEGVGHLTPGLYVDSQQPEKFGLCYRTLVGNDIDGSDAGYKIHVLYNVTAIPKDKTYASASSVEDVVEFEWDIVAVPEEIPGFRPTAHIVIDSRLIPSELMSRFEAVLYGTETEDPTQISLPEFANYIFYQYRFKIIDHGNGKWSVIVPDESFILFDELEARRFTLIGANAVFIAQGKYEISDTYSTMYRYLIHLHDDELWSVVAAKPEFIEFDEEDEEMFTLTGANVTYLSEDEFEIDDAYTYFEDV